MGRSPCCDEAGLKKGPWMTEEDDKLRDYINEHGHGSWRALPKLAGLNRCGKSCRLRWTNYLRPDIKRGKFSGEEEDQIIRLHSFLGNKWSAIAMKLPGRTDNEIKNYWNTHLRKKLLQSGIDPVTHRPRADLALLASIPNLLAAANGGGGLGLNNALRLQADAAELAKIHLLHSLVQVLSVGSSNTTSTMNATGLMGSSSSSSAPSLRNYQLPNANISNLINGLNNGSFSSGGPSTQIPNPTPPLSFNPNMGTITDHHLPDYTPQNLTEPLTSIDKMGKGIAEDHDQSDGPFPNCDDVPPSGLAAADNENNSNSSGSYSQMSSPCTNMTSNSSHGPNSPDNFGSIDQMQDLMKHNQYDGFGGSSSSSFVSAYEGLGKLYFEDNLDFSYDLMDSCFNYQDSSPCTWTDPSWKMERED